MEHIDLNKDVESPCEQTGDWGFYLVLENGTSVPIGVYSSYRDGAAHANAALRATPKAVLWQGQKLYREMSDDTVMTPERAEA